MIVDKHTGFKMYSTVNEADASFWKRPQAFIEDLKALGDLDIITELVKDYPPAETGIGHRDLKEYRVKIAKKDNPQIRCNLKMTTFGQGEFGDTNKTELAISGDCFVERKKKEEWWID